jgi:uncharacterized protein (TIGR03435 family)
MTQRTRNFGSVATKVAIAAAFAASLVIFAHANALTAQSAQAQTQQGSQGASDAALPSFEVASIQPHVADDRTGMRAAIDANDPRRWTARNETARDLICEAYDLRNFQVVGGPVWMYTEHFDISATVDDAAAAQLQKLSRQEQNQQMDLRLRSLLVDRFKLQMTRETKDEPAFALVIAKGGPKLLETSGHVPTSSTHVENGLIVASYTGAEMSNLAASLSNRLGRPVLDQTGLTWKYDIALQYAAGADSGGNSIFEALQDQLGLKLEPTRAPTEIITIEHIEEPSPN